MERDSFFEKLGKSLKLEDEQYEESSSNIYPESGNAETEEYEEIKPEALEEYSPDDASEEELGVTEEEEEELEDVEQAIEAYEQESSKTNTQTNLAMAKAVPDGGQAQPNTNMATKKTKIEAEKIETNITPEPEEEGRLTIDVYETESEIVIKSTIAGVEPEDLDINITSDSVTIRGKRQKDEQVATEDYFYQECYWGAFSRSVILPTEIDADKADAAIKNGVLTIRLPKLSKTQQKKLTVKVE